tara:strand:- start:77 stop:1027 length:951 start_codon:yes stop_codon:yes gene_type:complete
MTNSKSESNRARHLSSSDAMPMLLSYRKNLWLNHCEYVLTKFLLPWAQAKPIFINENYSQIIVLIENRINSQWLFTILNTILMCPPNTGLVLILDEDSENQAKLILSENKIELKAIWYNIEDINPNISLSEAFSFNQFMKTSEFWDLLPSEKILIVQTDALISEPLPSYFFEFDYLGAPFLPRVRSEYFVNRSENTGEITNFFKVDTPFNCSPNQDIYPHFYGNGGLSIRNRTLMKRICQNHGKLSSNKEQEDVFFSRNLNEFSRPVPLQIANTFAFETTYSRESIGSHAAWKYLITNELADYYDKHLRSILAMIG